VPQYSVVIPSVKHTFPALLSVVEHECEEGGPTPKIIVFGVTANMVALYAAFFRQASSLQVYELQSRLSQGARTRTTGQFKEAESGIMFATDVIGRGMDFPNVTSVIQVGLPVSGDQYVHRVGRTARVDKDGRAVILLTRAESFFLKTNPNLPIKPYEHTINETESAAASQALKSIDERTKQKAYSAYLGFMKGFVNKLRVTPEGLVAMANELAMEAFHCPEPPPMNKLTVGKMGLKGVAGIRYGSIEDDGESAPKRVRRDFEQRQPRPARPARPAFTSAEPGEKAPRGKRGPRRGNRAATSKVSMA
jgi:ATP-dependent RNA helicase MSS116, mitochondrial